MNILKNTSGETHLVSIAHMRVVVSAFFAMYGPNFTLPNAGLDVAPDTFTRLGISLYALNVEAVRQCYNERETPGWFRIALIAPPKRSRDLVPMLKAVYCLLYLCNIGTVPQDWALYRDLETLAADLAGKIITELPDYQRAPWHVAAPVVGLPG